MSDPGFPTDPDRRYEPAPWARHAYASPASPNAHPDLAAAAADTAQHASWLASTAAPGLSVAAVLREALLVAARGYGPGA